MNERPGGGSEETATFSVLVVDDVADLRLLVRVALEGSPDFKVVAEAEDGVQAVELAEKHRPDLVILDVSMPRQDGLQTLPQILERSPDSKVIVLSGFHAERVADLAVALGALTFIEKGVSAAQIVAAAREAVGLSRNGS